MKLQKQNLSDGSIRFWINRNASLPDEIAERVISAGEAKYHEYYHYYQFGSGGMPETSLSWEDIECPVETYRRPTGDRSWVGDVVFSHKNGNIYKSKL